MFYLSVGMPRAGSGWHYNLIDGLMQTAGCVDARVIREKYRLQKILTEVNCNIGVLSARRLWMTGRRGWRPPDRDLRRKARHARAGHLLRAADAMNTKTVIARMDEVLMPLGFHRKKVTWSRSAGSFVDVLDVQVSKAGDSMTINAGVLHAEVYEACWGSQPPSVIEVPSCTVHARVGQLIDLKDLWWPLNAERTPEDVAETLTPMCFPSWSGCIRTLRWNGS